MKNNVTFQHMIATTLDAMLHMIDAARRDVQTAREHIAAGERNAAIGASLPVSEALEQALALHKAVIAMHRFEGKEAS